MHTQLMGRLFVPVVVIVYCSYMIWEQYAGSYRAESRNYALFMGGLAIALALVVITRSLFKPEPADQEDQATGSSFADYRTMVLVLAGAVAVVLTIQWLGYLISFLAFLLYALWVLGVRKLVPLLSISIITTLIVHFGLVKALGLPLPAGLLRGLL